MTDEEIYKARTEGLNKISKLKQPATDERFLEFMSFIHEIISASEINLELIKEEVLEKAEIRKKMFRLLSR